MRYGGVSPHRTASYEDERRLQSELADRLRKQRQESEHVTERFEETIETEEHEIEERRRVRGGGAREEGFRGETVHIRGPSYYR